MKRILFKFVILMYGRIYYETLEIKAFGMKDPPDMVRFKTLALMALLAVLNIMAVVFLIWALLMAVGLVEAPSWVGGRIVDVVLILLLAVFFLLFRGMTGDFGKRYDQIKNTSDAKSIQRFVAIYPYLVFGVFVLSIVLTAVQY